MRSIAILFAFAMLVAAFARLPSRAYCEALRERALAAQKKGSGEYVQINYMWTLHGCNIHRGASLKCFTSYCGGNYCASVEDRDGNACLWRQPTCWDHAKCEVQSTGQCGWTSTPKFKECQTKGNSTTF
jgi:hypothetical protein